MSYQVLARKWRPRGFAEMVGQEHVLRALSNALDSGRLHHAFLFTGTRGVGKTTLARILAKSLNCEQGVSASPCGECSTCQEIDQGRFVDLIEVDAASRTKVEDTRELLDNVQYAPTRGRYKVYLVDEVHMLSGHSFNALLKTLEEPPPHVKFLLATTDPQKLPVTILSRCLQFNLRRLSIEKIQQHLSDILTKESITSDAAALLLLANAADGSMRDALSLLDQAIAFGGGEVKENDVRAMLGSIEQHHIYDILDALAAGQGSQLLESVHQLAQHIDDFAAVLADLTRCLHYLALLQQVPGAYEQAMGDQSRLSALCENLSAEDIQLYYQIALNGRRDLPLAPSPRNGLEMVLLRMLAFRPVTDEANLKQPPAAGMQQTQATQVTNSTNTNPNFAEPAHEKKTIAQNNTVENQQVESNTETSSPVKPATPASNWHDIVAGLNVSGILGQLVNHCALIKKSDDEIWLALEPAHSALLTKEREQQLFELLSDYFSKPIKLNIETEKVEIETPAGRTSRENQERQDAAVQSIVNDTNVQNIKDAFGANLNTETVAPVNSVTDKS